MFFKKIGQFRHFLHALPKGEKIKIKGSVKLHGTNAGIRIHKGEVQALSRSRVLDTTKEGDNYGFAKWVELRKEGLLAAYPEHLDVIVHGEWAGPGIQSGVAISEIPEREFFAFNMTVDGERVGLENWVRTSLAETYEMEIDTNFPEKALAALEELTLEVERECPVAKHAYGISGVGEGIVWRYEDQRFKVKGQKHSVSKVKKLVQVDPEVIENIEKFVEYAVTKNRLVQGLEQVALDEKSIGAYIGWVSRDIATEEADTLKANNLTMKQVGRHIANEARTFFMKRLNDGRV